MAKLPRTLTRFSIALAVSTIAATSSLSAQDVSFADKRVNIIIGATAGGGTDLSTRLVGRFMEKHLPGKPQVIYRNMPAGNGVQASNHFANEVSRDGTYLLGGANAYVDAQVLRQATVKYDPRNFHFIGGITRGGSIMVARAEKLANLTDRKQPALVIGTGDGTDTWAELMCWGAEVIGWNLRFVVGYPGTSALVLALRRGEIDSFGTSTLSVHNGLRQTGGFTEYVQIGERKSGKVGPRAYAPEVPTIAALVEDKLTGIAKEAFAYWTDSNQIDKFWALPPGTPAAVVATHRAAFLKAMDDPEFVAAGRKQIDADFGYQTGEEMASLVRNTSYPSKEITVFMHDLRVKHGLPGAPLTEEELARLASKLAGPGLKATSALTAVDGGGRVVQFKASGADHKGNVSSSNTKVTIAGKTAQRGDLKPGMDCEIAYSGDGGDVTAITCK